MLLAHPFWLLLLLLLPLPWIFLRRKGFVGYSDLSLTRGVSSNGLLYHLPLMLFSIAYVLLLIGLAQPQIPHHTTTKTIRTRDIVVAVDISGSMDSDFKGEIPKRKVNIPDLDKELPPRPKLKNLDDPYSQTGSSSSAKRDRRLIDGAQAALLRFVEDRYVSQSGDRVGILAFDTSPHWLWPLTDDLKQIWRNGLFIDQGLGGGTNFGELNPGPIDAAVEQFQEMGKSTTRVLILVTDGQDSLSDSTLKRLSSLIEKHHIHLYVVGVGDALGKANSAYDIFRLTEMVGGAIFHVEDAKDLTTCFENINRMERSLVEVESKLVRYQEIFFYFVIAAVVFIGLGLAAEVLIVSQ
jgi:Ca-activated chloride channel family protein